jgi:hypothetical protein
VPDFLRYYIHCLDIIAIYFLNSGNISILNKYTLKFDAINNENMHKQQKTKVEEQQYGWMLQGYE